MTSEFRDYPIQPLPFTAVSIQDRFWKTRIDTAVSITIPYDFEKCEETGRIDNFAKAGGLLAGAHKGIFYDDSDVFKVVEGAAYALQIAPDAALEAYLDGLIAKFAAAQEADGYLYTARSIDPGNAPEPCGRERWSNLRVNHELYNVGHMYEAAVAHYQATGKRSLLDIAIKNADLIDAVFGPTGIHDVPGHQEIELALARLYRVTGEKRYLRLAKFFLDMRGREQQREIYGDYCQDHLPVSQQQEALGHAVRAGYMYAGMADIAALTGADEYRAALDALWENVVGKKLALTGGVGARHEGEAFGDNYELPNLTAYNETCAAQANILWNQRMFLLTGDAKYIDILERSLYNGFLAGVGMDGKSFYYVNPLACDGEYRFNRETSMARQPWYKTSCCPTNVVRLLPSLSGYVYARDGDGLYVNLYVAGSSQTVMAGADITLEQRTDYPWDGAIDIRLTTSQAATFTLRLRIPAFARGKPLPSDLYHYLDDSAAAAIIAVDGAPQPLRLRDGYAEISREWSGESHISLRLPLPIRRVAAHPAVAELAGKVALERGPLVYALEAADNAADPLTVALADAAELSARHKPDLLNGLTVIQGEAIQESGEATPITAIPYYAWGHRGAGRMNVWLRRD